MADYFGCIIFGWSVCIHFAIPNAKNMGLLVGGNNRFSNYIIAAYVDPSRPMIKIK